MKSTGPSAAGFNADGKAVQNFKAGQKYEAVLKWKVPLPDDPCLVGVDSIAKTFEAK
jgi:hypothetical protein